MSVYTLMPEDEIVKLLGRCNQDLTKFTSPLALEKVRAYRRSLRLMLRQMRKKKQTKGEQESNEG